MERERCNVVVKNGFCSRVESFQRQCGTCPIAFGELLASLEEEGWNPNRIRISAGDVNEAKAYSSDDHFLKKVTEGNFSRTEF